jgi:hypothetical protein
MWVEPISSSYISVKVFFDLLVYMTFDCNDVRPIGSYDDDDDDEDDDNRLVLMSLYVTLFV